MWTGGQTDLKTWNDHGKLKCDRWLHREDTLSMHLYLVNTMYLQFEWNLLMTLGERFPWKCIWQPYTNNRADSASRNILCID